MTDAEWAVAVEPKYHDKATVDANVKPWEEWSKNGKGKGKSKGEGKGKKGKGKGKGKKGKGKGGAYGNG